MDKTSSLHRWFCSEVLVLEASLTSYLKRNGVADSDVMDLRQDVYERALKGAEKSIPDYTKGYLFTIARNLLINRARRAKVVNFELVTTWDFSPEPDPLTPERHALGRERLRRVEAGIGQLPPRCREVVRLRKIEGLSIKQVATRLNIGTDAVEQQTSLGMRALVDFMLGGTGKIRRRTYSPRVLRKVRR